MNIILWIGNEANQKALANKIHSVYPIKGIITETRISKKSKMTFLKLLDKIIERLLFFSIVKAWLGMKKFYTENYPEYPVNVKLLNVENINSDLAYEFSKKLNPDLIIVSGTRLIKEKMLSLSPSIGILNLHTGLSPYIKGGPNCTNWCIATEQFHLIGNTIMWIDLGIDTGDILTTEFTDLTGKENLSEIHLKVMEHAHNLYLRAIKKVVEGEAKRIKQSSIAGGKTYYTKDWTTKKKISLLLNLKKMKNTVEYFQQTREEKSIIEVKL